MKESLLSRSRIDESCIG